MHIRGDSFFVLFKRYFKEVFLVFVIVFCSIVFIFPSSAQKIASTEKSNSIAAATRTPTRTTRPKATPKPKPTPIPDISKYVPNTNKTGDFIDLAFTIGSSSYLSKSLKRSLDAAPFIENSRTLAPFKAIFEELGYSIKWNGSDMSIAASNNTSSITISMRINSNIVNINGQSQTIDVAPKIVNGRTFVPLKFIAENSGANVVWSSSTKTIYILKSSKIDTGTFVFFEEIDKRNVIYRYNGEALEQVLLENKEIKGWQKFKGTILINLYDRDKKNYSVVTINKNSVNTVKENFEIKDYIEYNDNILLNGYDTIQKTYTFCKYDGEKFEDIEKDFFIGYKKIFKEKLVICKYDTDRNYTLIVYDKSDSEPWTSKILKNEFVVNYDSEIEEKLYLYGKNQSGKEKPLVVYDGDGASESNITELCADVSLDIKNLFQYEGNVYFINNSGRLCLIDSDGIKRVTVPYSGDSSYVIEYSISNFKCFDGKLYLVVTDGRYRNNSSEESISSGTKNLPDISPSVLEFTGSVADGVPRILLNCFSVSYVGVESNNLIILGKQLAIKQSNSSSDESDTETNYDATEYADNIIAEENDRVLVMYDGETISKALDVYKLNNMISIKDKIFFDVQELDRFTNNKRDSLIIYKNSRFESDTSMTNNENIEDTESSENIEDTESIIETVSVEDEDNEQKKVLNLAIGVKAKSWKKIGDSLVFEGYETDISASKLYIYKNGLSKLLDNCELVCWTQVEEEIYLSIIDASKGMISYKYSNGSCEMLREFLQIDKIVKLKNNYYLVYCIELAKNSEFKNKKLIYLYDSQNKKFIDMKVNVNILEMEFLE